MTPLDARTLFVLMPGFTHHVDIGKGTDATISYAADGGASMRLPGQDAAMTGRWRMLADGYHIAWDGGPSGNWQIAQDAGRLVYIDPTGRNAGPVTRIEPLPA
jgi:hypothetical protein